MPSSLARYDDGSTCIIIQKRKILRYAHNHVNAKFLVVGNALGEIALRAVTSSIERNERATVRTYNGALVVPAQIGNVDHDHACLLFHI